MVKRQYPIYLPFDEVTPWICEHLVEKYEDKSVERPEWMNAATSSNFIKRIAVLHRYHGKDENEVDEALVKLFGRSGSDLESEVQGQLTFIKSKKSKKSLKIEPEKVKKNKTQLFSVKGGSLVF